jgi:hypothetical protein
MHASLQLAYTNEASAEYLRRLIEQVQGADLRSDEMKDAIQ